MVTYLIISLSHGNLHESQVCATRVGIKNPALFLYKFLASDHQISFTHQPYAFECGDYENDFHQRFGITWEVLEISLFYMGNE